jgi:Protein of unknown function (DUF1493)
MDDVFCNVKEHLLKVSLARRRGISITPETELYRDLGMYGDDIAFDVILWATREFGIEGQFQLAEYAPGEMFLGLRLWRLLRRRTGTNESQYKSLTVRDIVTAIETKRWPNGS